MRDITPIMEHFRESARHLWNTGYLPLDTSVDIWESVEHFEEVAGRLFDHFVVNDLSRHGAGLNMEQVAEPETLHFLHAVPVGCGVEININRQCPPCGYWDDPVNRIEPGEADLRFIGYFDFDVLGIRDFEYYRVRIEAFASQPHLVGRDALVRVRYMRVLVEEAAQPRPAG